MRGVGFVGLWGFSVSAGPGVKHFHGAEFGVMMRRIIGTRRGDRNGGNRRSCWSGLGRSWRGGFGGSRFRSCGGRRLGRGEGCSGSRSRRRRPGWPRHRGRGDPAGHLRVNRRHLRIGRGHVRVTWRDLGVGRGDFPRGVLFF